MSISITGLTPTMIAYETMLVLPCWMHSKNCYVLVMPFFSRRYSDMKHIDLRDKLSLLLELSLSSINRERAICSTEKERNLTYIILPHTFSDIRYLTIKQSMQCSNCIQFAEHRPLALAGNLPETFPSSRQYHFGPDILTHRLSLSSHYFVSVTPLRDRVINISIHTV